MPDNALVHTPKAYKTTGDHRSDALAMLEVTEAQLAAIPTIEHLFRGIGDPTRYTAEPEAIDDVADIMGDPSKVNFSRTKRDKKKVLEYLSGSEEPDARTVMALRARLTQSQADACPFEAYCVAAGLSTKKMFGLISQECYDQATLATALLAKARHPDVVQATIDMALSPLGDKDRKMLHQAQGFVPVPKTAVTHIHGNVDARQQTANVAVLPPFEDSIRKLADRFNTMTVKAVAAEVVEEDYVEEDED